MVRSGGEVPTAEFTRESVGLGGKVVRFGDGTAIARLLSEGAVLVNAYVGFRASQGFEVHWDDHEVFALQVAGRKRWKVWGRSTDAPLSQVPRRGRSVQPKLWTGESKSLTEVIGLCFARF